MKTMWIALCVFFICALNAKEFVLPVGISGISVKTGDSNTGTNLAFLQGKTPLCFFTLTVELYERPRVGWQGVGAHWTSLKTIRNSRITAETAEYTELIAESISQINNPPIRPLSIIYRIRVWKKENKVSMKLFTVTGTGPIEVKLRKVALPITFQTQKSALDSGSDWMSITFSNTRMVITMTPTQRVRGDLLVALQTPLWLMQNEPFDPELPEFFWNFNK